MDTLEVVEVTEVEGSSSIEMGELLIYQPEVIRGKLEDLGEDDIRGRALSLLEEVEILDREGADGSLIHKRVEQLLSIQEALTLQEVEAACAVIDYRNRDVPIIYSYDLLGEMEERYRAAMLMGVLGRGMEGQLGGVEPLTLWGLVYMASITPGDEYLGDDYQVNLGNLHVIWTGVVAGHILYEKYQLEEIE
jgi:hypothetical protein